MRIRLFGQLLFGISSVFSVLIIIFHWTHTTEKRRNKKINLHMHTRRRRCEDDDDDCEICCMLFSILYSLAHCLCVHAFAPTNTQIHWTQFEYARTACTLTHTHTDTIAHSKSNKIVHNENVYTQTDGCYSSDFQSGIRVYSVCCIVHHHTRYELAAAAIAVCSYISLSFSASSLHFFLRSFVVSRLWRCYVVVYGFCLLLSMCVRFKHNERTKERQMYFDLIIFDGVSVALSDFYSIILPFVPTRVTLYATLCAHTAWLL